MPHTDDDVARLAVAIGRINRRIRPGASGLTLGQLSALSTIVRRGPLRPSDLGRAETLAAPTVTRLVAELERRGLIERELDAEDRRSFFITATPAGRDAVLGARAERARATAALIDQLDAGQRASVVAALDALEIMAEPG